MPIIPLKYNLSWLWSVNARSVLLVHCTPMKDAEISRDNMSKRPFGVISLLLSSEMGALNSEAPGNEQSENTSCLQHGEISPVSPNLGGSGMGKGRDGNQSYRPIGLEVLHSNHPLIKHEPGQIPQQASPPSTDGCRACVACRTCLARLCACCGRLCACCGRLYAGCGRLCLALGSGLRMKRKRTKEVDLPSMGEVRTRTQNDANETFIVAVLSTFIELPCDTSCAEESALCVGCTLIRIGRYPSPTSRPPIKHSLHAHTSKDFFRFSSKDHSGLSTLVHSPPSLQFQMLVWESRLKFHLL